VAPSVELSPNTFTRLQTHAVPLVDTIETVINRMIDFYEKKGDASSASPDGGGGDGQHVRVFNPHTPPDLTHAKILGVSFCGKQLGRSQDNWNGLLNVAVREAKTKAPSMPEFKKLMVVNYMEGIKHDEGYRPLSDLGISVRSR
jgi:hypothetical protein